MQRCRSGGAEVVVDGSDAGAEGTMEELPVALAPLLDRLRVL